MDWLSGQILPKNAALKSKIAAILKSVAFGGSNLLLDISQKCLTCD